MSTLRDFGSIEPTFVAHIPLKKSPKFIFVTLNNPDDIKDPTKQTTIRRHAKRDADRARKESYKLHAESLMLEGAVSQSAVSHQAVRSKNRAEQKSAKQKHKKTDDVYNPTEMPSATNHNTSFELLNNKSGSLAFLRPLGAGRGFNSFAPYPMERSSRNTQLLDYAWETAGHKHRPMAAMWITIAMSHNSAFYLTLAHASNMIAQEHSKWTGETTESMKYYTTSVQAVSKQLQSPVHSTSDEVIATIIGFTCLDMTTGNWNRWRLHMGGLQRILNLRGGTESLQTSYMLQVTAFWNDVTGSLVLDSTPQFPVPRFVTGDPQLEISHRIFTFSQEWNIKYPDLSDIGNGIISLARLTSDIANQRTGNKRWRDELFVALKVHPVAHKLLSMSRFDLEAESNKSSSGLITRESLRLTSLLFIGLLKRHCSVALTGVPENKLRLTRFLTDSAVDWSSFMDLRLWVLTVSALAEEGEREWYLNEISWTMNYLGLAAWDDALKILKELIWVGEMLDIPAERLGIEVSRSRLTLGSLELNNL